MSRVGRAIPLDKAGIRGLSKELEHVLVKELAHREGPLGKVTFGQYPHDVRTVDGDTRRVWVRLQSVPSRDFRYVVGGALGEVRGKHVVVINVNGSLPAETIWAAAKGHSVQDQLYPVLLHELTHAADKFAPGMAETEQQLQDDPAAYYNDPSELRAYTQEVVDEVSDRFDKYEKLQRHFGNKAMGMLLRMSPTWERASPHWTRPNQNRVLKSVYQALEDWQRARRVMARYVGRRSTSATDTWNR